MGALAGGLVLLLVQCVWAGRFDSYTTCEPCVKAGHGWSEVKQRCGGYATKTCPKSVPDIKISKANPAVQHGRSKHSSATKRTPPVKPLSSSAPADADSDDASAVATVHSAFSRSEVQRILKDILPVESYHGGLGAVKPTVMVTVLSLHYLCHFCKQIASFDRCTLV